MNEYEWNMYQVMSVLRLAEVFVVRRLVMEVDSMSGDGVIVLE